MEEEDGGLTQPGPVDFEDTFKTNFGPMVRALTVACGDAEVAADCVQDAFSRAYVRWRRISKYEDPAGWIRHVATNRMRDHFRRQTRRDRAVDRLAALPTEEMAAPGPPSELADLLSTLPGQQRMAVAYFYVEGLSIIETANAMGLSEGAVKYHLHAARKSLRGALEEETA